jgi:hypothetical protein
MAQTIRNMPIQFEPKRNNRFVCEFPSELGIESWKVQEFKRPQLTLNSVSIPFINETNYVIGRGEWQQMSIVFLDPIGPSSTSQLMDWVRLHHESVTGRQGYAVGYKKNLILKALDPTGVEIEKWTIEQAMIVDIDFGQNSMEDDGLQTINLTIQPYKCIHNY